MGHALSLAHRSTAITPATWNAEKRFWKHVSCINSWSLRWYIERGVWVDRKPYKHIIYCRHILSVWGECYIHRFIRMAFPVIITTLLMKCCHCCRLHRETQWTQPRSFYAEQQEEFSQSFRRYNSSTKFRAGNAENGLTSARKFRNSPSNWLVQLARDS